MKLRKGTKVIITANAHKEHYFNISDICYITGEIGYFSSRCNRDNFYQWISDLDFEPINKKSKQYKLWKDYQKSIRE